LNLKAKGLKPVFHFSGARVEWGYGSIGFNLHTAPPGMPGVASSALVVVAGLDDRRRLLNRSKIPTPALRRLDAAAL
jgi:hypothetical protein